MADPVAGAASSQSRPASRQARSRRSSSQHSNAETTETPSLCSSTSGASSSSESTESAGPLFLVECLFHVPFVHGEAPRAHINLYDEQKHMIEESMVHLEEVVLHDLLLEDGANVSRLVVSFDLRAELSSRAQREDIRTCLVRILPLMDEGFEFAFTGTFYWENEPDIGAGDVLLTHFIDLGSSQGFAASVRQDHEDSWQEGDELKIVQFVSN